MQTNMNMKAAGPAAGNPAIGAQRAPIAQGSGPSGEKRKGLFSRGPIGFVVLGLHLALIYAVFVSLGIIEMPGAAKPMEAVIIDQPITEQTEPVPVVKPDLDQPPVETPPMENTIPEIEVPVDVPPPENAITAETAPAPPVAETANMKVNRRVDPIYPAGSRRDGEQGTGMFRVLVDERGRPMEVQVLKSSGFPRLDEAAMTAIRKWSFSPAVQNSQPMKSWTRVQVTFNLQTT
jgi:periplasmic protein TonB